MLKIMPIFFRSLRSSLFERVTIFLPFTITSPEVGGSSMFIQRTSVDFPAPDCPMMPQISPSLIVRLISFNALSRYRFCLCALIQSYNAPL